MKLEQFFRHHGIVGNPFSEEDAQTDTVFKRRCLATIHHPAWNKFFGSPADPSTALVFGEKGSGKTALRLQASSEMETYNQANPGERVFVISYDDFNPYLDNCRAAMRAPDMDQVLAKWRLSDHMDAILSLGVTHLVDLLTTEKVDLSVLSLDQRRDLLLLAALYDASTGEPIARRWSRLRRRSGFRPLWTRRDLQIGFGTTLVVIGLIAMFPSLMKCEHPALAAGPDPGRLALLGLAAGARGVVRTRHPQGPARAQPRPVGPALGAALVQAVRAGRPAVADRLAPGAEERYELLRKFQGVLHTLGYAGIVVLIDRVDEPQQVEGDPRKMRALIWPLLDHKFLRHPGIGVKLLLPDRAGLLSREGRQGVLRPGSARQAQHDQAAALDRPVAL